MAISTYLSFWAESSVFKTTAVVLEAFFLKLASDPSISAHNLEQPVDYMNTARNNYHNTYLNIPLKL